MYDLYERGVITPLYDLYERPVTTRLHELYTRSPRDFIYRNLRILLKRLRDNFYKSLREDGNCDSLTQWFTIRWWDVFLPTLILYLIGKIKAYLDEKTKNEPKE